MTAKINSKILPLIIPLSINSKDGIIDKYKDFCIESSFQNAIQPKQYNPTSITPKTRYTVFPCLNQYPLFIKGIIKNSQTSQSAQEIQLIYSGTDFQIHLYMLLKTQY